MGLEGVREEEWEAPLGRRSLIDGLLAVMKFPHMAGVRVVSFEFGLWDG